MGKRPFCVKGGEIIGNVPTIEELAVYIKEYILNEGYGSNWATDGVKGATRQAIYDMHQTVVGQLEYKGLWDASSGDYPDDPELGWYYVVSVAGDVGGVYYRIGDWIIWNGTSWDKLAGKADVYPIGAQFNYFGMGIKGDPYTRDYEISIANGDDFDMKGWFIANGMGDTPNCFGRFFYFGGSSGGLGGSNDAVVVEHTHGASQVAHHHKVGITSEAFVDGGTIKSHVKNDTLNQDGYMTSEQPVITVESEGVSGVDANMPQWIKVIPVIKMG